MLTHTFPMQPRTIHAPALLYATNPPNHGPLLSVLSLPAPTALRMLGVKAKTKRQFHHKEHKEHKEEKAKEDRKGSAEREGREVCECKGNFHR
jgi:hypothetical protein